jgi:pyruvate,water dikinase
MLTNILWFSELDRKDIAQVGGKNASLGEMIQHLKHADIKVPLGFATTAFAYRTFMQQDNLQKRINTELNKLDVKDVAALEITGAQIRQWILETPFLPAFEKDVLKALKKLQQESSADSFAIRSSATAEDLPTASFAGQQETYLNVNGDQQLLQAIKKVFSSLYTNRAISYREDQGFAHEKVALSVGVQVMVRSDLGASGVMFSLDTESGFRDVVVIDAAYGLGETVVQGRVNPDHYVVYKPSLKQEKLAILRKNLGEKQIKLIYDVSEDEVERAGMLKEIETSEEERIHFVLTDEDIETLARYAVAIDEHYQGPMDIEWAKDGITGELHVVQARPETVKSQTDQQVVEQYTLKKRGDILVEGCSVGEKIGKGRARVLETIADMSKLCPGDVLVTDMTDPDWEPIMKISSAIVTNRGGRTCHAAIVARELGIPAIVGTRKATEVIPDGELVTVSCAEGETGYVYKGGLDFSVERLLVKEMPALPVELMMNIANPDYVFPLRFLPNNGVGLARLEFIINKMIAIHPNAILNIDQLPEKLQETIRRQTAAYSNPTEFYISKLREGISTIAAAFYPKPVIVRTSDFKSNEYANLLGGEGYELHEENPMIGFRGASRYVDKRFRACFKLECDALRQVRDDMGLTNVQVMIPFVRTVDEGKAVIDLLTENGLKRGENGLKVIMMCEVPSNPILAEEFLEHFDGFSIGSNDLTQLTLGLDRDSDIVAHLFDERNAAVKFLLTRAIDTCNRLNKYIGICGQGPSDYPELAAWLIQNGIKSISLNPDTVVKTWLHLAKSLSSK